MLSTNWGQMGGKGICENKTFYEIKTKGTDTLFGREKTGLFKMTHIQDWSEAECLKSLNFKIRIMCKTITSLHDIAFLQIKGIL